MAEEEVRLTLKSLKKEFDEFKEWIESRLPTQNPPLVHGITEHIDPVIIPETPAKEKIRFHITHKEIPFRDFTEETHGENWREIANEFHQNNVNVIRKREDF